MLARGMGPAEVPQWAPTRGLVPEGGGGRRGCHGLTDSDESLWIFGIEIHICNLTNGSRYMPEWVCGTLSAYHSSPENKAVVKLFLCTEPVTMFKYTCKTVTEVFIQHDYKLEAQTVMPFAPHISP